MTEETMCNRNKIGKEKLHKSLKYLLEHKWIKYVGTTPAKTRSIKTYEILDIWGKNVNFYQDKKIPPRIGVSKDTAYKTKDTAVLGGKIPPEKGGIRRSNIKKINKKKYNSVKNITEQDIIEIANKYNTSVGFVKLQLEKLKNYCEAKGRIYKNYKSALRNFVLGDMQRQIERKQNDKYRPVDARNIE